MPAWWIPVINSMEYAQVFGEETVPFPAHLAKRPRKVPAGLLKTRKLFGFSAPFEGAPHTINPLCLLSPAAARSARLWAAAMTATRLTFAPSSFRLRLGATAARTVQLQHPLGSRGNGMASQAQMDAPSSCGRSPAGRPQLVRLQQIGHRWRSVPKSQWAGKVCATPSPSTQAELSHGRVRAGAGTTG